MYRKKSEERIERLWSGGLDSAIKSYQSGEASIQDITEVTGILFRAIRRVFAHHGVKIVSRSEAQTAHYARHPERKAKISAAHKAITIPAEQRGRMIDANIAAIRRDPSIHINARVNPSIYESKVIHALQSAGISYRFNHPSPPFWLDFYFPEMSVGLEIQRTQVHPDRNRHNSVVKSLGLRALVYYRVYEVKKNRISDLINLLSDIKIGSFDPSIIGEYSMFGRNPRGPTIVALDKHKFRWAFGAVNSKNRPPVPKMS